MTPRFLAVLTVLLIATFMLFHWRGSAIEHRKLEAELAGHRAQEAAMIDAINAVVEAHRSAASTRRLLEGRIEIEQRDLKFKERLHTHTENLVRLGQDRLRMAGAARGEQLDRAVVESDYDVNAAKQALFDLKSQYQIALKDESSLKTDYDAKVERLGRLQAEIARLRTLLSLP